MFVSQRTLSSLTDRPHLSDLYKLGLYGGRVDAFIVEELLYFLSQLHVLRQVTAADVGGCYDTISR